VRIQVFSLFVWGIDFALKANIFKTSEPV
jgi:hypothetical protein